MNDVIRTSNERVSTADLEACRSWLVARGDSLARSRDMILMVDELLERRSSETPEQRTDHAENLAKALEHYLSAHDTLSAVQDSDEVTGRGEASDCGFQDTANDAWRAMRTALYEYRKRRSQKALEPRTESILDRKVTVCASCLCASCWQGDFYCDNYKTASTVDKTVRELFQINANGVREDSGYWFKDVDTGKVDYYAKSAAKRAFNALSEGEQS